MSCVYFIQNIIDGSIYVGKTSNVNRRWTLHKYYHKKKQLQHLYLYRSFTKYGIENFTINIIEGFDTCEEALEAEIWWIEYLKSAGVNLYNITSGGEGNKSPCTEKAKKIIGAKNKKHAWKKNRAFENSSAF